MRYNYHKNLKRLQGKIDEARKYYNKSNKKDKKQTEMKADYKEQKIHNDIERNILYFAKDCLKINEYE